ncbi:MAG: SRPBCC family protein [Ilumatobacteraceae bacterium]
MASTSSDSAASAGDRDVATVERFIPAPAEKIFDLLADPARHRDIDGSGTVRAPAGGSQRLALGSVFGMGMRLGIPYKMVNEVVEFEENRRIAWQPRPPYKAMRRFIGGRIWRYELEPREGGTLVRESWDIRQEANPAGVRPMRSKAVDAMTKTLERIERIVTAS